MSLSDERKIKIKKQIQQRVDDRILEKSNGELLIKLVDKCNEQEADALLQMATNNQTTGLHFDSRYEVIDTNTIKYLKKDEKHSFIQDPNKPINKLILGDNYDALRNLLISYKEQVDIIYIDPPYASDSMGNFAKTNYKNNLTRDNLLSMLQPRLELAEELLADGGAIFVSIDDKNQAYVKCLMDEVFGEENFVNCIINQSANSVFGSKASAKNKTYIKVKDYVLVYKKGDLKIKPLYIPSAKLLYDSHEFILEDGKKYSSTEWFKEKYILKFKKMNLKINSKTIQYLLNTDEDFKKEVMQELLNKQYSTSPYSRNDLSEDELKELNNGKIIKHNETLLIQEGEGTGLIRFCRSLKDSCQLINGEWVKCDILGDIWNNSAGYGNINAEGDVKFASGKKPLMLLKRILASIDNPNALVLDFFAGSGSMGHAVLEQNLEDGGNRQFILCTLEADDDYVALDVCGERLKKVMTGVGYKGTKYKNKVLGGNLEVDNITKINNTDKNIFNEIDETLYGLNKFTNIKDKIDWVCNNFDNCQKEIKEKNYDEF